jgi:hypothetical protein
VASREAAASRPSTGGGIEAEHWVEGEEGGVEGGDGLGVEDRIRVYGHEKMRQPHDATGKFTGTRVCGAGGTRIYTWVVVRIG